MFRVFMIAVVFSLSIFMSACGPDIIMVRPSLDTPAQHVSNGNKLLERGKLHDACREFMRARELDPGHLPAYVGLGLALGRQGDVENGLKNLERAQRLADSPDDRAIVEKGYRRFREIQKALKREKPIQ